MKTLFAMAVAAVTLIGCGPLDENETVAGQTAQTLEVAPDPTTVVTAEPATVAPLRSAQEALVVPDPPRTFETTYLYATGIQPTAGTVPSSSPR